MVVVFIGLPPNVLPVVPSNLFLELLSFYFTMITVNEGKEQSVNHVSSKENVLERRWEQLGRASK